MAELLVAAEPRRCVVAQPPGHEVPGERGAEPVERGGVPACERSRREPLQPVAVAAGERPDERQRPAEERDGELRVACSFAKEGDDAVLGRQGAVDVENRDDGTAGRGFGHRRTRLYTRCMTDGPEIFDDLYLGLQAGGALRKQRRGEELTEEERLAIGRWQQMSMWRKGVAVGAFALGTFGLGFTLGGLVFGRRARKA